MGVGADIDRRAASGAGDGAVAKKGGSLLRPATPPRVRSVGTRSHRHMVSHAGGSRKGEDCDLRGTQTAARNLDAVDCCGHWYPWDGDGTHFGLSKRLSVHDPTKEGSAIQVRLSEDPCYSGPESESKRGEARETL